MKEEHGIKVNYMDRSADPSVDFFRYANGSYLDSAVLPSGYSSWGSFLEVRERSLNQLHDLMKAASIHRSLPFSNERKIANFYASGMNQSRIEDQGIVFLSGELAAIARLRTHKGLATVLAHLHLLGASPLFGFGSMQSFDDSSAKIAAAYQSGLGLPDRDYYLADDDKSTERLQKYAAHIERMFRLLGEKRYVARRHAKAVVKIETKLAAASMPEEDQRDPANINHPLTVAEFQNLVPLFPVKGYLAALAAPAFDTLNVLQPNFFKAVNELLKQTALCDMRAYLRWQLISATAPYLSAAFVNEDFEFYGKTLSGLTEQRPRWKSVVNTVNGALGEVLGQLYVAKYFPASAKIRALEMIDNLKTVLRETIVNLSWMSEETKKNALAKLEKTVFKIGYPDKWLDYGNLKITTNSYVGNVMRANEFAARLDLAKIGQPVDRKEWHMTPQTVNAYADPQSNELVFPAAILQPPFFDPDADDAANYGAILVVIGHEFTHLFDDSGAQYDANGNVNLWWGEADFKDFMGRISLIREQFSRFQVGNVFLKGQLVSGEAAADLGGVKLAYKALQLALAKDGRKSINGFSDEERFFIAFAQLWASISTPEAAELQAMTDPHPAAQFRVNGTVAHIAEFAQAFKLADDCPIMLPVQQRCQLW